MTWDDWLRSLVLSSLFRVIPFCLFVQKLILARTNCSCLAACYALVQPVLRLPLLHLHLSGACASQGIETQKIHSLLLGQGCPDIVLNHACAGYITR